MNNYKHYVYQHTKNGVKHVSDVALGIGKWLSLRTVAGQIKLAAEYEYEKEKTPEKLGKIINQTAERRKKLEKEYILAQKEVVNAEHIISQPGHKKNKHEIQLLEGLKKRQNDIVHKIKGIDHLNSKIIQDKKRKEKPKIIARNSSDNLEKIGLKERKNSNQSSLLEYYKKV